MKSNTLAKEELQRQKKSGSRIKKAVLIIIIIAAALYVAGIVFFRTHFYGAGSVFGISMRMNTVEGLKTAVSDKLGEYRLVVVTRDGDEFIDAEEMGLVYDDRGEVDELMEEQNPALWLLMSLTSTSDTDISVAVDEDMLGEAIEGLDCMQPENETAPTDAYLEYEDGSYAIVDDTPGNTLVYDSVYQVVYDAVINGEDEVVLDAAGCYQTPDITSDNEELIAEMDELNNNLTMVITYDFDDRQITAGEDEISAWMQVEDDLTYSWDEDAIKDFVYQMAYDTDTMGLSRTFTTHSGSQISLKGGDYGWLINQSSTVEQLIDLLNAGESTTVEPVYRYTAMSRAVNDIGDSYVEVSISDQNMWVYKDGSCVVDTPVVTGKDVEGRRTPSGGVWAIDGKVKDYYLTGQDYNSHVDYWLPFNGNVGIHDADWRSSFGGDIYKTNGSHGCVNTPPSVMKTVYDNVEKGYPVIVY